MRLTELLVPTYSQMLRTLNGLLDKAVDQLGGAKVESMLSARLAPDMYPLSSQLRFAAFQAQEATFRLQGQRIPSWLDEVAAEGRNAGEQPGSIEAAKARLEEALAHLERLGPNALDAAADQPISLELPGGIAFDLNGEQYARDWALAQFYFHVITTYAILRNHGVQIGKADYVPHMFAYLRPGPLEAKELATAAKDE